MRWGSFKGGVVQAFLLIVCILNVCILSPVICLPPASAAEVSTDPKMLSAAFADRLEPEEKAWLKAHPEISMGMMNAWPPMNFVGAWLFLRAVLTVLLEGDIYGFMSAGPMQGFSIIAGEIGHIFIAIGLVIINAQRLEKNLTSAKEEIITLRKFLPICSFCKKIRDDKGYWNQLEEYIDKNSDIKFSHGICPECMEKHYPDLKISGKKRKTK